MGLNTIPARVGTILTTFFDDIRARWIGDFVGMDATGAPVAGCNLGNPLYPWGAAYFGSAVIGGSALDVSQIETQPYKTVSGAVRSTSNQPDFLRASGSTTSFSVLATTTPIVLQIAGVTATWSANKSAAGTVAPSSQNTATVNDATATGGAATRTWGELGSGLSSTIYSITIASAGTNITNKVGTWQAFKVGTEYFLAYVESSTSLSRAFRGFFLDSSGNPVKRATFSNGDTITLMSLGWVLLDKDGTTVDVTYNNPTYAYSSPSGPSSGDYWFDQGSQVWKRYNGSSFVQVDRTLVGLIVLDSTNCVASRCFDFFALFRSDNTIDVERTSNTIVKGAGLFSRVNVSGRRISFLTSRPTWDAASNLAASSERYNASVTASVTEYFYVTDKGDTKISDFEPHWRADLLGWYHPHNTWRAVGQVTPDGSAHFNATGVAVFGKKLLPVSGQQISSASGNFSTTGGLADVSGLTVTIETTGRPVLLCLIGDGSGVTSFVGGNADSASGTGTFLYFRDSTEVHRFSIGSGQAGSATAKPSNFSAPGSTLHIDFNCPAGLHTFKVQAGALSGAGSNSAFITNCKFVAIEL